MIDSAHVQLRQDYAYASLTGVPNVLDSADVSSIAGGLSGVDSAYVTTQIDALIDGAPGALNTLNELAAAINDDSQAYNTLLSLVNGKLDSAGRDYFNYDNGRFCIRSITTVYCWFRWC